MKKLTIFLIGLIILHPLFTQNLFQNATQTEYVIKNYEERKLKEKEFSDFWLGKQEVYDGAY